MMIAAHNFISSFLILYDHKRDVPQLKKCVEKFTVEATNNLYILAPKRVVYVST